jgi:hypothetical protein
MRVHKNVRLHRERPRVEVKDEWGPSLHTGIANLLLRLKWKTLNPLKSQVGVNSFRKQLTEKL